MLPVASLSYSDTGIISTKADCRDSEVNAQNQNGIHGLPHCVGFAKNSPDFARVVN